MMKNIAILLFGISFISVNGSGTPAPSMEPTTEPTTEPTMEPTVEPTMEPTMAPNTGALESTDEPTMEPTMAPNAGELQSTDEPTMEPTMAPTMGDSTDEPTMEPTMAPNSGEVESTDEPTMEPTMAPTMEDKTTKEPTMEPTMAPTATDEPTPSPITDEPTMEPTMAPTMGEVDSTDEPTMEPTMAPTMGDKTTKEPTMEPTIEPTMAPTAGNKTTASPTMEPTMAPTMGNKTTTASPTMEPTTSPTMEPTTSPTMEPTTNAPTKKPTTGEPTKEPTLIPSMTPTLTPTPAPTIVPTNNPTAPTPTPTNHPTITAKVGIREAVKVTSPFCGITLETAQEYKPAMEKSVQKQLRTSNSDDVETAVAGFEENKKCGSPAQSAAVHIADHKQMILFDTSSDGVTAIVEILLKDAAAKEEILALDFQEVMEDAAVELEQFFADEGLNITLSVQAVEVEVIVKETDIDGPQVEEDSGISLNLLSIIIGVPLIVILLATWIICICRNKRIVIQHESKQYDDFKDDKSLADIIPVIDGQNNNDIEMDGKPETTGNNQNIPIEVQNTDMNAPQGADASAPPLQEEQKPLIIPNNDTNQGNDEIKQEIEVHEVNEQNVNDEHKDQDNYIQQYQQEYDEESAGYGDEEEEEEEE